MVLFRASKGQRRRTQKGPLPKICHTYPAMTELSTLIPHVKDIEYTHKSRDIHTHTLRAADISLFFFLLDISNIYQEIQI